MLHAKQFNGRICYGLTLWRWNQTQVELWLCPSNFSVDEHVHEEMDSEIILLIGNVNLCKRVNGEVKSTGVHFKKLSVPRNTPHFIVQKSGRSIPTAFMNIEHWYSRPTSVCEDFKPV